MEKIENWDNIEAKGMEDFKSLPIGAYECVIVGAVIHQSEISGKESFKVAIDIATGEYKDYFRKRFDANTNEDKKWDNNAVRYLAYQGDNASYFKGFLTSVENSNPGYKWDWDESKLKGKKICGVFQYEEYEKQDGTKGVKVRLNKFRSLDKLKDIEVSDSVRLLNNAGYMPIDDYNEKNEDKISNNESNFIEIGSDDLPF